MELLKLSQRCVALCHMRSLVAVHAQYRHASRTAVINLQQFAHNYGSRSRTSCVTGNFRTISLTPGSVTGNFRTISLTPGSSYVSGNFRTFRTTSGGRQLLKESGSPDEVSDDLEEIIGAMCAEDQKKFKILQLEYDVWESVGDKLPSEMTKHMWLELFHECPSVKSRKKLYKFWFKREKIRESAAKRKEKRKADKAELGEPEKSDVWENRFLPRISKTRMNNQLYASNLAFSMVHGPHLVFDMSFEENMEKRELNNLIDQIILSHGANHVEREPFHLHFCNVKAASQFSDTLYKRFPGLGDILYTVTDKNYLDFYDKDSLVYLSPNAPDLMTSFDYNKTYIVGGIVDKSAQKPLTFAKAKREGIPTAKLPLDKYLIWRQGSKALTLDQMVKILLTLKATDSDWQAALSHVPRRKH